MKIKFLLVLSLLILSFGFISSDDKIIGEKGIASVMIGVSTLKDVKKSFPNGKAEIKKRRMQARGYACSTNRCIPITGKKHTAKFLRYVDEKNGVIFNFGRSDTLGTIIFMKSTSYKTDKGIAIGDSFDKLDSLYGTTSWNQHITGNRKIHGNLQFYPNDSLAKKHLTIDELNTLQNHKLKIGKIVLSSN